MPPLKPVIWLGDSLRELRAFPSAVQDEMGYALYLAQRGEKHVSAKPLKGLGSGVLEVVSDHRGDTFRSVYTVRLADRVFVLHVFQKKSKRGAATPTQDVELIKQRLKRAVEISKQKE
jgi:phage-related protein